jgi:hypothetical protein
MSFGGLGCYWIRNRVTAELETYRGSDTHRCSEIGHTRCTPETQVAPRGWRRGHAVTAKDATEIDTECELGEIDRVRHAVHDPVDRAVIVVPAEPSPMTAKRTSRGNGRTTTQIAMIAKYVMSRYSWQSIARARGRFPLVPPRHVYRVRFRTRLLPSGYCTPGRSTIRPSSVPGRIRCAPDRTSNISASLLLPRSWLRFPACLKSSDDMHHDTIRYDTSPARYGHY